MIERFLIPLAFLLQTVPATSNKSIRQWLAGRQSQMQNPDVCPTRDPADFAQLNQILSGLTLEINETAANVGGGDGDGDGDGGGGGGGLLSLIDLNLELDLTQQLQEGFLDQGFEIPDDIFDAGNLTRDAFDYTDAFDFPGDAQTAGFQSDEVLKTGKERDTGKRRRLKENNKESKDKNNNKDKNKNKEDKDNMINGQSSLYDYARQGALTCPVPGAPGPDDENILSGGTEALLNIILANLTINFGDEINALFENIDTELDDQCLGADSLAGSSAVTRAGDTQVSEVSDSGGTVGMFSSLMSEVNYYARIQDELSLTFGEELNDFLMMQDLDIDDILIRSPTKILGITLNLDVNITNITCDEFGIKELNVTVQNNGNCTGLFDCIPDDFSNLNYTLGVTVKKVAGTCYGRASVGFGMLNVATSAVIQLVGNKAVLDLTFAGGGLTVNSCESFLRVRDIDFSDMRIFFAHLGDDFVNSLFDHVEHIAYLNIEDLADAALCDALANAVGGISGNFAALVEQSSAFNAQQSINKKNEKNEKNVKQSGNNKNSKQSNAVVTAKQEDEQEPQNGEVCFESALCENLRITGGTKVTTSVEGAALSADIEVRDFFADCYANVLLVVSGIEITGRVTAQVYAPSLNVKATLGDPPIFDDCTAELDFNYFDVSNLIIGGLVIPEALTDSTVDQLHDQAREAFDGELASALCSVLNSDDPGPFTGGLFGRRLGSTRAQEITPPSPQSSLAAFDGLSRHLQDLGSNLGLMDGFCGDLQVQEVLLKSETRSDQAVGVNVMMTRLTGVCTGILTFDLIGNMGTADVEAVIVFDSLDADILLVSEEDGALPNTGCLEACESMVTVESLTIDNVQLDDSSSEELFEVVFEALQEPTANLLETLGEETLCSQIGGLVPGFLEDTLPQPGDGGDGGDEGDEDQSLTITDTVCDGFSLQTLVLSSRQESSQLVVTPLEVDDLTVSCTGQLNFGLGGLNGTADFSVDAVADLIVDFGFISPDFSTVPPTNGTVEACQATVRAPSSSITNLVVPGLDESLTAALLGLVDGLFGDLIEEQGSTLLCEGLEDSAGALTDAIAPLSDGLNDFLGPRPPVDPLAYEKNYTAPPGILDLQDPEGSPAKWFSDLVIQSTFLDANFLNGIVAGQLNEDGFLSFGGGNSTGLGTQSFDAGFATVNLTILEVQVGGLDSFTEFGERIVYGQYTFGFPFRMEYVYNRISILMEILPTGDGMTEFENQELIQEYVELTFNATDVQGNLAALTAFKEDDLGQLNIISLASPGGSDCLLPTLDYFAITQLQVTKSVTDPAISNFTSLGTQCLASSFLEALWLKYEPSILLAMPNIWQEELRIQLNEQLIAPSFEEPRETLADVCPQYARADDLSAQSVGNNPYGDAAFNVNGFRPGGNPYGNAASSAGDFLSSQSLGRDPVLEGGQGAAYGEAATNADGFTPGGQPYGLAADNARDFMPGDGSYGKAVESILAWDPLKNLNLPPVIPRRSFFRKPNNIRKK